MRKIRGQELIRRAAIVVVMSVALALGDAQGLAAAELACPNVQRIHLGEASASIDGVQLGEAVYRIAAAHHRDLNLRMHWGPRIDSPCGWITGVLPDDPDGLAFVSLPGEDALRLGAFSLHCQDAIDVPAVVTAIRGRYPELEFFPHGPPWDETSDESPVYVSPGRDYFILVKESGISVGLDRCFPGRLGRPDN